MLIFRRFPTLSYATTLWTPHCRYAFLVSPTSCWSGDDTAKCLSCLPYYLCDISRGSGVKGQNDCCGNCVGLCIDAPVTILRRSSPHASLRRTCSKLNWRRNARPCSVLLPGRKCCFSSTILTCLRWRSTEHSLRTSSSARWAVGRLIGSVNRRGNGGISPYSHLSR